MSQVHCLECGSQVIVDPRGQCPVGHTVGTPGNRIEMAMGHETAHPDEPEPWVHRIAMAEVDGEAEQRATPAMHGVANRVAEGSTNGTGPARQARPVRAPGLPADGADDEPADAESLLRELHSLAALDTALTDRNGTVTGTGGGEGDRDGHPRQGPPTIPATPPPPPAEAAATAPRRPRGNPEEIADAFAELSALDVPASTTNGHRAAGAAPIPPAARDATAAAAGATPPSPPREASPADGGTAADELASLFGAGPLSTQDDPPDPTTTDAAAVAGTRPAAPSAPAASTEQAGTGGAPPTGEDDAGLELEALFQAPEPPPAAPETARSTPRSSSQDRPSPDPDAATDVPPAVPLRPRRVTAPAAQPAVQPEAENGSQPAHAAAGSTQVLDLSSFTAKGGSGAGRSTGRRRRFGR
ncbi:MAG: hypothetical protein EA340_10235 [Nitriliruptor sp.]|nr:MAG: hypothetical protein EA340_10235 [Nitriliruptor sp.]